MTFQDPFAHLRSVYRLFLRSASASVLHHSSATKNLRKLYRPFFRDASSTMHRLAAASPDQDSTSLIAWLKEWNIRMDNTLKFMYTSSQSRGLPHEVTANLAFLLSDEQMRLDAVKYLHWRSDLPAPVSPHKRKAQKSETEMQELRNIAASFLGEAISMAEAHGRLSLGRVKGLKKKPRKKDNSRRS
ncbi:hypothetical protein DL96DRAFT_1456218 [Flagelloscypha sp. PMI_526]|nr:hypothetical protein DL96DRAFT_1456218 [Flagelloscypha sp. PMI_526]